MPLAIASRDGQALLSDYGETDMDTSDLTFGEDVLIAMIEKNPGLVVISMVWGYKMNYRDGMGVYARS